MSNNIELLSKTENFTIGTNSNLSEILANVVKVGTDTSNVTISIPQDISSSYNLILPVRQGASGESLVYGADGQLKWHDTTVLKQVVSVFGSNLGSEKVDSGQMGSVSFPTNYEASITPLSANTKIFVQFKINYKAALSYDNQVDFYIYKNDTNGNTLAIFSETMYGPYIAAGGFVGQYISNLIDEPNTTDEITYKLGYKINGTVDISDTLGILGYDLSYNNTIVLQEFEGSGVYATSVWNKGADSNGLYYNDGTVHIGSTKNALGSQNTPGVALELSGNLVGTNATFSGNITAYAITVEEAHIGPNTLYINGTRVLNQNEDTGSVNVYTDQIISESTNGLTIQANGNNGSIILDPSGTGSIQLNGDVQLSGGNINAETFIGDLSGNVNAITISATTTTTNNLSLDGTLTTSNSSRVVGNLIPSVDDTYSLGAPDRVWKDVYIGPGSLYLNGTKILDDSSDTINMRTDIDQALNIQTSGTGTLTLRSDSVTQINSGNILASPAQTGSIILNANGGSISVQSDLVLQGSISMSQTGTSAVPLNLNDDVDVAGDLDVGGNLKVNRINREDPGYSGLYLESVSVDGSSITGQLIGNVTGDVNGNLVGNVTGDVNGNLVGNVTGDVTGDVNGNLVGNVTGDVNGNLVGNVTGDVTGDVNGNLVGNVTGHVTGTVSSLANLDTDHLSEGSTNLYYTTERVRGDVSGGTGINYNESTGVFSLPQEVSSSSNVKFNNVTVDGTLNSDDITGTNVSVSNNLTVAGNLTVNGTQTIVNSTVVEIGDNKIVLNAGGLSSNDAGIIANVNNSQYEFYFKTEDTAWYANEAIKSGTGFIGDVQGNLTSTGNLHTTGNINLTNALININFDDYDNDNSVSNNNTFLLVGTTAGDPKFEHKIVQEKFNGVGTDYDTYEIAPVSDEGNDGGPYPKENFRIGGYNRRFKQAQIVAKDGLKVYTKNDSSDPLLKGNIDCGNVNGNLIGDVTGDVTGNVSGVLTGSMTMTGHIIPSIGNTFDIGSPDRQIRDMYVSNNTIYLGEVITLSVDEQTSQLKVKRRKTYVIPKAIKDANPSITSENILTATFGTGHGKQLSDLKMSHYRRYARDNLTIGGKSGDDIEISDIFTNDAENWEEDISLETLNNTLTQIQENLNVGGNITSRTGYFIGDGSQLTGITSTDTISNLSDTNITSLTNKNLLVYDSGSSKWINSTIGINDLNDVNTSGILNTNVLKYNGSSFVAGQASIDEISEFLISTPGATEVLKYNGTKWVNQPVNVNEINGIDLTLLVNNELLRKDGANNSVVGADIITSTAIGGGVTSQKTRFVNADGVLFAPLSSIESKSDSGTYSMTLNPNDANASQTGKFVLVSNNNNTRVGINVNNPAEELHLLGNFRIDNNTTQQIRFYNTQGAQTKEAGTIKVDDNGGGADILFLTRPSGGTEPTEKMIINKTGNVGIGTSSPSQKLEVNGTIRGSNLITNGYLELNPDAGLTYNAQLRHDNFYPDAKPDQIKMFLRNHAFWSLQDGTDTGNGGDGQRKMIIDVPLEVNGDIKGDNLFLGEHNTTPKIDMFFIDTSVATGDNNKGEIWDTKIEIGKSDDFTNSPAFPPSNAYGMNVQANSDGLFVGVETYDSGNNWRPLLKWGDESTDTPFRIVSHSPAAAFEFGTDGNYKISGNEFRVRDILHIRYNQSAYEIQPKFGWSGSFDSAARLVLNQYTASLRVLNTSNAEITSVSPYKNGYIYYKGTPFQVSDDRLKSYETDVSNATDMILKLKPKFYKKHPTLITDDPEPDLSGVLHFDEYGFIAQELKEDPQLSHFVSENPNDNIYHVNYVEMIPLLVQTIKELNERIKVLESRN